MRLADCSGVIGGEARLVMKIPIGTGIGGSHKGPISAYGDPDIGINHLDFAKEIGLGLGINEFPILIILGKEGRS